MWISIILHPQKDLNCQVILVYSNLLVKYFYVNTTNPKVLYTAGFTDNTPFLLIVSRPGQS